MENNIIEKIIEFAKKEIDNANFIRMDHIAKTMVELLEFLGFEKEADEVYNYYEDK